MNKFPIRSVDVSSEIDLTKNVEVKTSRPERIPLRWVQFDAQVFAKMLTDFESARPDESIVWTSGNVDAIGLAYVKRYWGCGLKYATTASAMTDPKWLQCFIRTLSKEHPDHNLIIENHSHPIGSQLSRIDEQGLYAIYDWNYDIYWMLTACDFQFGA